MQTVELFQMELPLISSKWVPAMEWTISYLQPGPYEPYLVGANHQLESSHLWTWMEIEIMP